MRVVLVEIAERKWRLFRQERWMGELRARPEAGLQPRRYFDIEAEAFSLCMAGWNRSGASRSLEAALERLRLHAAQPVQPPSVS